MSSNHESQRIVNNDEKVNPQEPKEPCKHPLIKRDQLSGSHNYLSYKNVTCSHGFKVMDSPTHKGSRCNGCMTVFCANPGCGCKRQ